MNERFLRDYSITPRPAFIQDLRNRLATQKDNGLRVRSLQFRPIALGAITLLLALTVTLAISPSVRAQLQEWTGVIGGVFFTTTGDYPGEDGAVTIIPSEEMSLEEARAILPFVIDLPTSIPEGYALEEKVSILRFEDGVERVFIHWSASEKALLELEIENTTEPKWLVGPESIDEVLVRGKTAALVRGGWNADTKQWDNLGTLTLYLAHNDQTYIFVAREDDIPVDKLLHIAESLP
jgi:hypothetical protein